MLKRFTLASVFMLFLISPAHATPDKDLKDWTEQDILSVNASLQSALRHRIELAKLEASNEQGVDYLDPRERLNARIAPFGSVCVEGDGCGQQGVVQEVVQGTARSGSDIYSAHCFACHTAGVAGAPKIGVLEEWEPRLAKGRAVLMATTKNGINAMPPMGTCMDCSDEELQSAIDHMLVK